VRAWHIIPCISSSGAATLNRVVDALAAAHAAFWSKDDMEIQR